MVAEVSDVLVSALLGERATAYSQAGITEYWVLDIMARRGIVRWWPQSDGYAVITWCGENTMVSRAARPEPQKRMAAHPPPK